MKISFKEFIYESKNYPIYKGVDHLWEILKSGLIKDSGQWASVMRQRMGIEEGISVSRFFSTAVNYGNSILELDTVAISDNYKILPFSENPDFHLWYIGSDDWYNTVKGKSPKNKKSGATSRIKDRKTGSQYWDYKTNKSASDFQIAEEVILAKELPIKYIKKVYIVGYEGVSGKRLEKLLKSKKIDFEYIDDYENLAAIRYKDKKKAKVPVI